MEFEDNSKSHLSRKEERARTVERRLAASLEDFPKKSSITGVRPWKCLMRAWEFLYCMVRPWHFFFCGNVCPVLKERAANDRVITNWALVCLTQPKREQYGSYRSWLKVVSCPDNKEILHSNVPG